MWQDSSYHRETFDWQSEDKIILIQTQHCTFYIVNIEKDFKTYLPLIHSNTLTQPLREIHEVIVHISSWDLDLQRLEW